MTIRMMTGAVLPSLVFVLGMGAPASAARFEIVPGAPGNLVRFESKATVESFDGKTNRVGGFVDFDPDALGDSVTVRVEVDLASLDTGIELRNRHMRENHLETARFPTAVFEGGTVLDPSDHALASGRKVTLGLTGRFELHGVRRTITVPVEVTRENAEGAARLSISAAFPVRLSDYGISRPKFLVLKLADEQAVSVRVTAVSRP